VAQCPPSGGGAPSRVPMPSPTRFALLADGAVLARRQGKSARGTPVRAAPRPTTFRSAASSWPLVAVHDSLLGAAIHPAIRREYPTAARRCIPTRPRSKPSSGSGSPFTPWAGPRRSSSIAPQEWPCPTRRSIGSAVAAISHTSISSALVHRSSSHGPCTSGSQIIRRCDGRTAISLGFAARSSAEVALTHAGSSRSDPLGAPST